MGSDGACKAVWAHQWGLPSFGAGLSRAGAGLFVRSTVKEERRGTRDGLGRAFVQCTLSNLGTESPKLRSRVLGDTHTLLGVSSDQELFSLWQKKLLWLLHETSSFFQPLFSMAAAAQAGREGCRARPSLLHFGSSPRFSQADLLSGGWFGFKPFKNWLNITREFAVN